jgi:hypothetical protein
VDEYEWPVGEPLFDGDETRGLLLGGARRRQPLVGNSEEGTTSTTFAQGRRIGHLVVQMLLLLFTPCASSC